MTAHDPAPAIAYPGRAGAFAEEAARALVPSAGLVPCASVEAALDALASGDASYAVMAIENSLGGPVRPTLDALGRRPLVVVAEHTLQVEQRLCGPPGATFADVRRVRSHPIAFAQCRRFFAAHPALLPLPTVDTASAMAEVALAGDPTEAAIGSLRAAAIYGARVLVDAVQDPGENRTRFVMVAPASARR